MSSPNGKADPSGHGLPTVPPNRSQVSSTSMGDLRSGEGAGSGKPGPTRVLKVKRLLTHLQQIPRRSHDWPVLRHKWAFYSVQVVLLAAVYFGAAKLGLTMA